jgi:hypothetical protein
MTIGIKVLFSGAIENLLVFQLAANFRKQRRLLIIKYFEHIPDSMNVSSNTYFFVDLHNIS